MLSEVYTDRGKEYSFMIIIFFIKIRNIVALLVRKIHSCTQYLKMTSKPLTDIYSVWEFFAETLFPVS